jgi:predicted O-methyltransferase YrrM
VSEQTWTAVDDFLEDRLLGEDPTLQAALDASEAAGLPAIAVTPSQGKLLHLLARSLRAHRILELGTLGGYSSIWLARALEPGGQLVTLEANAHYAQVAAANIERAGLQASVELRVGKGLDTLPVLAAEAGEPFDLVFIDADKIHTPDYFRWALQMTRAGSVIIADNVIADGGVIDESATDTVSLGSRAFHEMLAHDPDVAPRVSATTIQTVGAKGYDGFTFALVL